MRPVASRASAIKQRPVAHDVPLTPSSPKPQSTMDRAVAGEATATIAATGPQVLLALFAHNVRSRHEQEGPRAAAPSPMPPPTAGRQQPGHTCVEQPVDRGRRARLGGGSSAEGADNTPDSITNLRMQDQDH